MTMSNIKKASKKLLIGTVLLGGVVASLASAQTINSSVPNATPDDRYAVISDGTVIDSHTGLMWSLCVVGLAGSDCSAGVAEQADWADAVTMANESELGGYSDWRLPNVKELNSIFAFDRFDPSINLTVFPNTPGGLTWTSTISQEISARSWVVDFSGGATRFVSRQSAQYVRLVRDASQ